jgi:hypothetical protein
VSGQAVSPLKVKRATKGQGPSWLMATTYLTSSHPGAAPRSAAAAAAAAQRFQPARQLDEVTREQQLADIEVGLFFKVLGRQQRSYCNSSVVKLSCGEA